MASQTKIRDPEHMGAKEVFGVTSLSMISSITAIFMSSLFMQYMTDYAGLGAWGATLATTLTGASALYFTFHGAVSIDFKRFILA